MTNVFGRLALLTFLVLAGVTLWYGQVQVRLQEKVPTLKEEAAAPRVQKSGELGAADTDHGIILSRNIFNAALDAGDRVSGEQPPANVEDLAETKIQLVLLGTVSGSKEDARAIIRHEKTKTEDIYHVGSELHGAIITRIGRGKIVLQVNGSEEVLNIKETESGRGPQPVMQTDGSRTRPASVVVPQRRISFRNPAPVVSESEPVAPEPVAPDPVTSIPVDSEASSPAEEQEKQDNDQLVPNNATVSPESGTNENTGQPSQ